MQVGPWPRQEFVEGDAEHLGDGHDVAQTRVGRGAGHGLALLELLVGVPAHSRIVCHPLLRQPARLAQSLHAQAQLFRVRGPSAARSNLWHNDTLWPRPIAHGLPYMAIFGWPHRNSERKSGKWPRRTNPSSPGRLAGPQ